MQHTASGFRSFIGASVLSVLCALPAWAQDPVGAPGELNEVVVTGTRFGGRLVTESPTPIDNVSREELVRGGQSELHTALKFAVPSFASARPSTSGANDFLKPPSLRGLSPGQLLLLVNGKRRHTGPLNLGNQIGRGDIVYDFTSIPTLALQRIEVLRDGAAAQYGSDAIAGVINLVLDESTGAVSEVQFGATEEGDGEFADVAAAYGFEFGDGGRLRLTAEYQNHNATNRAEPDTRQQYFGIGTNGAPVAPSGNYGSGVGLTPSAGTLDPREGSIDRNVYRFGDAEYEKKLVFVNGKLPLGKAMELYSFGGYSELDGSVPFFFRRAGQIETVRGIHPDGFRPAAEQTIENYHATAGLRGDELLGFRWDVSSTYGGNSVAELLKNTNNVSYGLASPTEFENGRSAVSQWTSNFDLSREVDVGGQSPLGIAFGAEYRWENFRTYSGDPLSYTDGGVPILDGPSAGAPAPAFAQPGQGIRPENEVNADRESIGVYGEVEKEFFDRLLLTGAVRYEDYSDFGDTTNYKASSRFEISPSWAIRASYGTGFRAPALSQSFYSQTVNQFVNGEQTRILFISVNDPIAPLVGGRPLKPEKSKNLSVGTVVELGNLTASVDFYRIDLRDRIAISSNFSGGALTALLAANGFDDVTRVTYITNALDTTTEGFDVTASYRRHLGRAGTLNATLAANYNDQELDRLQGTPAQLAAIGITTPLIDLTQQVRVTDSMPRSKVMLNLNWQVGKIAASFTNTYFGEVRQVSLTGRTAAQADVLSVGYDVERVPAGAGRFDLIQTFEADIVTDLELSYAVTDSFQVFAGASNLFDAYPEGQLASSAASVAVGTNGADNNGTFPYAYIAPYGVNGRTFYGKMIYRF